MKREEKLEKGQRSRKKQILPGSRTLSNYTMTGEKHGEDKYEYLL
jgi:hypothetical protein